MERASLVTPVVAAEHEGGLHHGIGLCEALSTSPHIEAALEGEVVAQIGMDHRRLRHRARFPDR